MSRSYSTCSTITDSLPSTSSAASISDSTPQTVAAAASSLAAAATTTTLSFRDEHAQPIVANQKQAVARHQLSSHHHYHLPHQFQHPHHQNHHTHNHGVVPVPTPTVPASYTASSLLQESRHMRAASGSGDESLLRRPSSSPPPLTPTVTPSPNLLVASETTSHTSVSPAKLSARMRDSGSQHRVTIDESNLPQSSSLSGVCGGGGGGDGDGSGPPSPGHSSQQQLTGDERQTGHLALMYHSSQLTSYPVLPAIKRTHRPSFMYPPMPRVRA